MKKWEYRLSLTSSSGSDFFPACYLILSRKFFTSFFFVVFSFRVLNLKYDLSVLFAVVIKVSHEFFLLRSATANSKKNGTQTVWTFNTNIYVIIISFVFFTATVHQSVFFSFAHPSIRSAMRTLHSIPYRLFCLSTYLNNEYLHWLYFVAFWMRFGSFFFTIFRSLL